MEDSKRVGLYDATLVNSFPGFGERSVSDIFNTLCQHWSLSMALNIILVLFLEYLSTFFGAI